MRMSYHSRSGKFAGNGVFMSLVNGDSESLLYRHENEDSICLVYFNTWPVVKRLLNLKKFLKKC